MALTVKPNTGHYALAALAKKNNEFLCLTQNVDGLSPRAGHPAQTLRTLHGNLFTIKCSKDECDWMQHDNYDDPFCPALTAASEDVDPGKTLPLLDPNQPLAQIPVSDLPRCPKCKVGLQRPGVVWFGESLDLKMLDGIDTWIAKSPVDLVLVIGTSAVVHPAASYIFTARSAKTVVATINLDAETKENLRNLPPGDFAFGGDAAELLPRLLEPIIGKLSEGGQSVE
jgi:NAD-dependent SIR2 family protein deacetylase